MSKYYKAEDVAFAIADREQFESDLISRQAAIEALGEEPDIALDTEEEWAERDAWARHVRAIESLPPVTPTCPTISTGWRLMR